MYFVLVEWHQNSAHVAEDIFVTLLYVGFISISGVIVRVVRDYIVSLEIRRCFGDSIKCIAVHLKEKCAADVFVSLHDGWPDVFCILLKKV